MLLDHYKMVVWVRFPHLPIHFYHPQVLPSLGNLLGRTIKIDFNTQRAERGKFSRIAIEIDLSEPLAPVVELDGNLQKIEYENLPDLCFECGMVGHGAQSCPKIQRKPIQPESETVEGLAVIGAAPCRSKRRNRDRTAPGW
ncbi:hypothetical protein LINPERHAP2_LOCUS29303 [Linum perenne]